MKYKMIFDLTPIEIILREPSPHMPDLPIWGQEILDFVAPRYLLEAEQVTTSLYGRGNRTGKKKLYQLSKADFLKRYELYCEERERPVIGYALGNRGMRITRKLAPEITMDKMQEYIIANEFIFINDHKLDKRKLAGKSTLIIGEVSIKHERLGLWCPRNESESRIKSLAFEATPYKGLIVIAPNQSLMLEYFNQLKNININKPIYYTSDSNLETLWHNEDGILSELYDEF